MCTTQLCCYVDFFLLPKIFVEIHQSSNHDQFFYWTVLMDTNRCMYGVSVLCQREQIHTKAEQASFGEFHLNLDILAIKANSAYVITNLSNETSHMELSTEKCLIFPLFPSLFAAIQQDMKMRTTALPCYTVVGPSTEYTPMEFLEAYK